MHERRPRFFTPDIQIPAFIVGILAIWQFLGSPLWAIDCPSCGEKDLPDLTLVCLKCGKMPYENPLSEKTSQKAVLVMELFYTGDNPDRQPDSAKLFINRKFRGNIPLVERKAREPIQLNAAVVNALSERKRLGVDYTAVYRLEVRNLDEGIYNLHVEMNFRRILGILPNNKRADFHRVFLKPGEKTFLRRYFDVAKNFSKKPQEKDLKPQKPAFESMLRLGSGTMSLEIPFNE